MMTSENVILLLILANVSPGYTSSVYVRWSSLVEV